MSALAWTLSVTVSLPTNVPAPGLKRTVKSFDCADARVAEKTNRTKTSSAWRAGWALVTRALDVTVVESEGNWRSRRGATILVSIEARPLRCPQASSRLP